MTKEYIPREEITAIALELLELYKGAEEQNIWEYSSDFKGDTADLEKVYEEYKERIVSIPAADVRPNDGPKQMTVGELLTAFPWTVPVEVYVPDGHEGHTLAWVVSIYGNVCVPEKLDGKVISEVKLYDVQDDPACLEIYTK